MLEYYVQYWYI